MAKTWGVCAYPIPTNEGYRVAVKVPEGSTILGIDKASWGSGPGLLIATPRTAPGVDYDDTLVSVELELYRREGSGRYIKVDPNNHLGWWEIGPQKTKYDIFLVE